MKLKNYLKNSKKTLDQEYETSAKIIKDKLQSAKKKLWIRSDKIRCWFKYGY